MNGWRMNPVDRTVKKMSMLNKIGENAFGELRDVRYTNSQVLYEPGDIRWLVDKLPGRSHDLELLNPGEQCLSHWRRVEIRLVLVACLSINALNERDHRESLTLYKQAQDKNIGLVQRSSIIRVDSCEKRCRLDLHWCDAQ